MSQRPTTATPMPTPGSADEAREPREELLSGSTPGAHPHGEGVIEPDEPEDRARKGSSDLDDEQDPLKIR